MTHPNAIQLEAVACGERAPQIVAHLDACDACRGYVERAKRAAEETPRTNLLPVLAAGRRDERARRLTVMASSAGLLAAAAVAILWVGSQNAPRPSPEPAVVAVVSTSEPDTTFKGRLQLAVIRERGEKQERFIGEVPVRPGDRLRVEVALDRPGAILAAVLDDDGSYLELMNDGVRPAGTHFSEKSARVDTQKTSGVIVVGAPDAVRRARMMGKPVSDLATVRVQWEAP